MNHAIIAFIILAVVILMLVTEWIPNWATSLGICACMILTGILPPLTVLREFYTPTMLMIVSIFILGDGIFRSGVADGVGMATGNWATRQKNGETIIIAVVMLVSAFLSTVLSNLGVAAAFIPVVLTVARYTKISRTKLLMGLAVSSTMGGMITLSGSPPNLLTQAALLNAGYDGFGFFGLVSVGLPITLFGIAYMLLIGMKLVPARYDESEPEEGVEDTKNKKYNRFHQVMSIALFLIMVAAIIFENKTGVKSGYIGIGCCAVLLLTRVLTLGQAWKALNWKMTCFVAGMLVLSSGLNASGASSMIAGGVVALLGGNVGLRVLIAVLYLFSAVLTQFLNNTAQTGMLLPIAMSIAVGMGMNPTAALITICIGSSSAFATAFGTPANAMVTIPGRIKFIDWLKVGIPLVAIGFAVCVVILPMVYPA